MFTLSYVITLTHVLHIFSLFTPTAKPIRAGQGHIMSSIRGGGGAPVPISPKQGLAGGDNKLKGMPARTLFHNQHQNLLNLFHVDAASSHPPQPRHWISLSLRPGHPRHHQTNPTKTTKTTFTINQFALSCHRMFALFPTICLTTNYALQT